ncbi:uncharacterized protein LOC110099037 [Dendrobium catenatum]|uniref:Hapless 8 n=1 Tax=Dendrobium catenatum TaxID=906689 RepID=A0A2I0VKT0_9ASPA|nr:uncharacterized protein LOC110099037 [Dendrobium catenatum]XP_020681711.1 uncharacterized protein LOC110099037 [Dendrobium catenatum]PKU64005.1 hypothetical protein MA16_Dca012591 [Dendrobium catenatum]
MLSLVNSSDPSCSSSKVSGLRADERDSGQLPLQEADPVVRFGEARTSNFSIRDHVFALRNKSIGKSWPFPSQLLQLCLKNGIRDLLPPFEPPNSVRAHCFIRSVSEAVKVTVSSSQLGETVQHDGEANSTRTDQLCLSSDQQDLLRCSDKGEAPCLCEQDKYDHNLVNDVCEIGSTVTNHCDIDIFSAPIGEPELNKCRLILKPGVIPETSLAEEYSTTSTASDIMASKVCPVCKAFSSTSNTTLNAHMDQCLSMESEATLAVDKLPKLRVKPRKKRLMEDIYATAPICTLEDLDRRNGSTWATDLSVAALSAEANSEPKKPKLSHLEPRDDKNEGAVYVDSNGIKLRILSKFNDAPQALTREEVWPRRNIKSVQDGKIILIKKKNHFTSTYSKKIKLKLRNKKLSSLKLFENEVQAEPEVDHHEESHLEDEASPVQLSGEADQSLSCGSATLKNWPSSKRSDLAKKVGKKDFHKILERTKPDTHMEMLASDTPSSSKSYFGKLSQLLESKTVDLPPSTVRNKENQEKSSQRWPSEGNSANVLLKLSRVPESLVSATRSNSEEFYVGRKPKSHIHLKTKKRSADHTYQLPLKTKRVSTVSGLNTSAIKFRKHQSLLAWTDRRIGEASYVSNPRQHRSVKAVLSGQDKKLITNQRSHPSSSQYQDTQTRISDKQVNQKMDLDTLEKADTSCITPNPLVSQDQDVQHDTTDKRNLTMPIQENEMPVAQVLLEQDKAAPEKLVNIGVESQAKGKSAQESSVFLTDHGDLEIDIPRANSTTALGPLVPNQEIKLVSCREPSISPASSASTISPSSPNDYHSKASVLSTTQGKLSFPLPLMLPSEGTQEIDMDRNQLLELDSTVKKPHQLSDYHPCCCSWQSIMAGNTPPTKQKPLPNLHIRPSISSFYAYSSLKSDAANTPSLESPTESILTRACSDVGSTSPSSGTPTQSSSNSILRLMGKDLMVVHNEESAHLPKALLQATDNNSTVQTLPSPLGFASYARLSNHDTFSFAVCNQSPSITSSQARNCLPSFHQRDMNHKAYTTKEVIVIDDSDDAFAPRDTSSHVPVSHAMFQRPFTYFPPHSHLLPKDNGLRLSNPTNQVSSVPAPHLPRPFVFQSPSANHMDLPFYYPQSLR